MSLQSIVWHLWPETEAGVTFEYIKAPQPCRGNIRGKTSQTSRRTFWSNSQSNILVNLAFRQPACLPPAKHPKMTESSFLLLLEPHSLPVDMSSLFTQTGKQRAYSMEGTFGEIDPVLQRECNIYLNSSIKFFTDKYKSPTKDQRV